MIRQLVRSMIHPTLCATALLAPGALAAAGADTKIADVDVKIDDLALVQKSAAIRTLYITLYDADAPAPRPYGAMRVVLEKDAAKGTIFRGALTSANVMIMGGGPMPKNLKIKARLDKDGSAGPDEKGDLVGIVEKIAAGASTTIVIDKAL